MKGFFFCSILQVSEFFFQISQTLIEDKSFEHPSPYPTNKTSFPHQLDPEGTPWASQSYLGLISSLLFVIQCSWARLCKHRCIGVELVEEVETVKRNKLGKSAMRHEEAFKQGSNRAAPKVFT